MYWPLGTPRIYATSNSCQPAALRIVSHDGLSAAGAAAGGRSEHRPERTSLLSPSSAAVQDGPAALSTTPVTPVTPATPLTPGIKPVEHDYPDETAPGNPPEPVPPSIPLHEPILALRVARAGHIFAVITATSMTVWQTKVRRLRASLALPCCLLV
jgi:hypothetical protein